MDNWPVNIVGLGLILAGILFAYFLNFVGIIIGLILVIGGIMALWMTYRRKKYFGDLSAAFAATARETSSFARASAWQLWQSCPCARRCIAILRGRIRHTASDRSPSASPRPGWSVDGWSPECATVLTITVPFGYLAPTFLLLA